MLIVGSILPGLYYGFYGHPWLQAVYTGGIISAGIASGYVSSHSLLQATNSRWSSPPTTADTGGTEH